MQLPAERGLQTGFGRPLPAAHLPDPLPLLLLAPRADRGKLAKLWDQISAGPSHVHVQGARAQRHRDISWQKPQESPELLSTSPRCETGRTQTAIWRISPHLEGETVLGRTHISRLSKRVPVEIRETSSEREVFIGETEIKL